MRPSWLLGSERCLNKGQQHHILENWDLAHALLFVGQAEGQFCCSGDLHWGRGGLALTWCCSLRQINSCHPLPPPPGQLSSRRGNEARANPKLRNPRHGRMQPFKRVTLYILSWSQRNCDVRAWVELFWLHLCC